MRVFTLAGLAAASLAAGCAMHSTMTGPTGGPAHSVMCHWTALDTCYARASELCPSGYTFLDRPLQSGFGPHRMLVECKA